MNITDRNALYVHCDGAMTLNSESSGGIGFVIKFPEFIGLDDIKESFGQYVNANIERIEFEALIQAMIYVRKLFDKHPGELKPINRIIFVTDRFALRDAERTHPSRVKYLRANNWKTHEGKPVKNHKLIDKLDKERSKLSKKALARVEIQFRRRKYNRGADKLAKAGKKEGLKIDRLASKGDKIGKRKYQGDEVLYKSLKPNDELHVHVFRKESVQKEWEVWVEICSGKKEGCKLKIYADHELAEQLQRGNEYIIHLEQVFTHHVRIFETVEKLKKPV